MKKVLFMIVCLLFADQIYSQVINIEDKRIKTDTVGWAGRQRPGLQ